jgi:hypothetical protein
VVRGFEALKYVRMVGSADVGVGTLLAAGDAVAGMQQGTGFDPIAWPQSYAGSFDPEPVLGEWLVVGDLAGGSERGGRRLRQTAEVSVRERLTAAAEVVIERIDQPIEPGVPDRRPVRGARACVDGRKVRVVVEGGPGDPIRGGGQPERTDGVAWRRQARRPSWSTLSGAMARVMAAPSLTPLRYSRQCAQMPSARIATLSTR